MLLDKTTVIHSNEFYIEAVPPVFDYHFEDYGLFFWQIVQDCKRCKWVGPYYASLIIPSHRLTFQYEVWRYGEEKDMSFMFAINGSLSTVIVGYSYASDEQRFHKISITIRIENYPTPNLNDYITMSKRLRDKGFDVKNDLNLPNKTIRVQIPKQLLLDSFTDILDIIDSFNTKPATVN